MAFLFSRTLRRRAGEVTAASAWCSHHGLVVPKGPIGPEEIKTRGRVTHWTAVLGDGPKRPIPRYFPTHYLSR